MNLKALDTLLLTKITSQQVDHVTCLECCKYFIAPETASCGHTLCHTCWRRRRTCPSCAAPLDKRSLKLNLPMQARTQHIQTLGEEFEKLFNIKLDEFVLDLPSIATETSNDPTKNVKDWLASSQNQFSAPLPSSETSTQYVTNPIKLSSSKIQIHSSTKKSTSPEKVMYVQLPQDDWDKIEQLPDTEDIIRNKENLGSTNKPIIPVYEDNDYTMSNPRRSSRKRESNHSEPVLKASDTTLDKNSSKNSSSENDKKSTQAKQNWNNVKRMRKEFSKLNKINRNKLNVSIEMCKKTKMNKPNEVPQQKVPVQISHSQPPLYIIEDNTPNIDQEIKDRDDKNGKIENINSNYENCESQHKNNEINMSKETDSLNKSYVRIDNINLAQENICETNIPQTHVQNKSKKMSFIKKSLLCPKQSAENNVQTINIDNNDVGSSNNDDIEITIKIGNTLTNIVIKKKSNDLQLKVNTDREVQTSLGSNSITSNKNLIPDIQNNNVQNVEINIENQQKVTATEAENNSLKRNSDDDSKLQKSACTKKNTASAETETGQFEITESVEKELSNIMECKEIKRNGNINKLGTSNEIQTSSKYTQQSLQNEKYTDKGHIEYMDDLDLFDNGSVHEKIVQPLNKSKYINSEILVSSLKTNKKDYLSHKRDREFNVEDDRNEMQSNKKFKCNNIDTNLTDISLQKNKEHIVGDSDSINYDVVMNQVFANIDTDIEKSQKEKASNSNKEPEIHKTQDILESQRIQIKSTNMSLSISNQLCAKEIINEKYSENVFSVIEKDTDTIDSNKKKNNDEVSTQHHIDNLLTPGMCHDLIETEVQNVPTSTEIREKEVCTPYHDPDDSDRSVVEETPQKNVNTSKQKSKNEMNVVRDDSDATKIVNSSQMVKSIINISDTDVKSIKLSKNVTNLEPERKITSETPVTIDKFMNYIKHNSTPVARKSLNFDRESVDDDDPEQTLCPSLVVAKTTQEKEFMSKAFEQTPISLKKPLMTNNIKINELQFCIAGSCLAPADLANVKLLCRKRNWKYVDKYTNELTHLVVSVDDENKSQRSVKYMCALAASKWIVSNQWVEACLKTNLVLGENHYEVLDGTGEPGPKRSRLAKQKLFQGITFFCMPPFSVLDPNTLKEMLESSGGQVVNEAKAVKATCDAPALLLAEPEHTQEDRFMYLAIELGIVPVNYEWVLNCLGSYSLSSIHDLLLCPSALLPPETSKWPAVLISRDSE